MVIRARSRAVAGIVALAFCSLSRLALADGPTAAQDAQAEDLFQRAKAAMAAKNYLQACPWFAESYRLAGGGGTLQNLAVCYEEEGKLAFAYNRFIELRLSSLKAGNHPERVKLADEHIEKLKPRLSRIRVHVAEKAAGTKLTVDGDEFGEASWDAGIVVNRGSHVVRVTAPGKKPREVSTTVKDEGKLVNVDVPPLETDAGAVVGPVVPPPKNPGDTSSTSGLGFAIGGAGAAVAIAGGVFGILTITTNNAATNACNQPGNTDPAFDGAGKCYSGTQPFTRANDLHERARTFGTVSTILLPVGLVAAALGTYLVISSPSASDDKPRATARVVPSLGGLSLMGEFQ